MLIEESDLVASRPADSGDGLAGPGRLEALRALAEPVRLAIVDELGCADACACELRERLGLSASLLSHHLRVLREAGLVRTRRAGRRLEVELDRVALARLAGSLAPKPAIAERRR